MEEGWKVVNYIKIMTSVVGCYTPSHARPVFVAICRRESSVQNRFLHTKWRSAHGSSTYRDLLVVTAL